jgi:hypothetical protein
MARKGRRGEAWLGKARPGRAGKEKERNMNRMIHEHIAFYERQLDLLQWAAGKYPRLRGLRKPQIGAMIRILEALRAFPEEQATPPSTEAGLTDAQAALVWAKRHMPLDASLLERDY